ncbi:hypothetical protein C8R43DRAFT_20464 [Mycena crocata]|nr:hypothetical protein C8R43DRAFT_20464 [Mycena crocata]
MIAGQCAGSCGPTVGLFLSFKQHRLKMQVRPTLITFGIRKHERRVSIPNLFLPLILAAYVRAACLKLYTVKSGDNCDAIAVAQGISSYQVAFLNNKPCNSLQIGQVLCLIDSTYNCQPVYTVTANDLRATIYCQI